MCISVPAGKIQVTNREAKKPVQLLKDLFGLLFQTWNMVYIKQIVKQESPVLFAVIFFFYHVNFYIQINLDLKKSNRKMSKGRKQYKWLKTFEEM